MKKLMKVSGGFILGALLCIGILAAPQNAEAATYVCPDGSAWFCYDYVQDINTGVIYWNVGLWCNFPAAGQATCWYTQE